MTQRRIHFVADTHFFHDKMVELRGFASAADMHVHMIEQWNARVHRGDIVYHQGDVSFASASDTDSVMRKLMGDIHLVPGNHDERMTTFVKGLFEKIHSDILNLKACVHRPDGHTDVHRLVLCHFPIGSWKGMHHGTMHLHGHSHGNYPPRGRMLDVGVDNTCDMHVPGERIYAPISLEQVLEYMATRTFEAVDQHTEKEEE